MPSSRVQNVVISHKTATEVKLTWAAVECSLRHGLPLGYSYELRDEYAGVLYGNVSHTVVILKDLIPYTDYTFRVRFLNQAGYGYYSEPVDFTTHIGSKFNVDNLFTPSSPHAL